ncbi:ATP-binding cassette domain-containing protein [Actinomadura flavalba]|uniref:ATP-binding cassette domain-containing protein n=1 Tax=Actinomadura flavalba TaxID=1120938 RepID=UPI00037C1A1F|nr:ATP-binding cassette domain-containing protein [Actinomadura flavalba]
MPGGEHGGLRVDAVTVRADGALVLDDVALRAHPGAVTGIVGPPGAGKTTLADVVTGWRRPESGTVTLDGTDLTGAAPYVRARAGLARTVHGGTPFGSLSVRDNVRAAVEIHALTRPVAGRGPRDRWRRRRAARASAAATADVLLARTGIAPYAGHPAARVPAAVAPLLEIARALATRPRVLLLDEPAAGLTDVRARALEVLLRDLAAEGLAVVLTAPDLSAVLGVCDTVHVLDRGRVAASGPPAGVRGEPRVRALFAR